MRRPRRASAPGTLVQESLARSGAAVMGRRIFDHGEEPWGDDGTFRMPVFVVAHRQRERLVKGPATFTFVAEAVTRAVELARAAADGGQVVTQSLQGGC